MEKYVTSREWAEKLKAAGYPLNTQFAYIEQPDRSWKVTLIPEGLDRTKDWMVASPMSDEILEQLPESIIRRSAKQMRTESLRTWKQNGSYTVGYQGLRYFMADKPADALAQLLLYCKENGHIK